MRLPMQTLPLLATALFLLFPNLATGTLIREDNLIYDQNTGLYWTDGNFKSPDAAMTWKDAKRWVASLNKTKYGGFSDWRLPYTPPGSAWGYNANENITKYEVTVSELGHLYYDSLGKEGYFEREFCVSYDCKNPSSSSFPLTKEDFDPFLNLSGEYWFGRAKKINGVQYAWTFDFGYGSQFLQTSNSLARVIAVREAHPTPEPSTAFLFLTGLLGLCRICNQPAPRI